MLYQLSYSRLHSMKHPARKIAKKRISSESFARNATLNAMIFQTERDTRIVRFTITINGVDGGGFEPPKSKDTGFTVQPG